MPYTITAVNVSGATGAFELYLLTGYQAPADKRRCSALSDVRRDFARMAINGREKEDGSGGKLSAVVALGATTLNSSVTVHGY